jgi:sec-independent protein translocase protein TatA
MAPRHNQIRFPTGRPLPAEENAVIGDLFDSPWKILIVAVVIIVLFGSRKLPHAARSLGQSMRILKREVQGLHEDEPAEQQQMPVPAPDAEAQLRALQAQVNNLHQRTVSADGHGQADSLTRGPDELG